jgi:hypothetical protein
MFINIEEFQMKSFPNILFHILSVAVILASLALESTAMANEKVIYVDSNQSTSGNGTSWANAYKHLQDGLADAHSWINGGTANVAVVRVAGGNYQPDLGSGLTAGDRTLSFELAARVCLLGGYAGTKADPNDPYTRNPSLYITILDGDLKRNDRPGFVNYEDNSYNVVRILDSNASPANCRLDGVTIRGGNAVGAMDEKGLGASAAGGILVANGASLRIDDCVIIDHLTRADDADSIGGITVIHGQAVITNCRPACYPVVWRGGAKTQ